MQIVCPNCTTSYQIAAAAIGANGRSVRCVRCQTVWFAVPPAVTVRRTARAELATRRAPVAAFRAELGGEPELGRAATAATCRRAPAAPILRRSHRRRRAGTRRPPTARAEPTPAVALADIPIPVEDAPPLAPAAGDGAPARHVAGSTTARRTSRAWPPAGLAPTARRRRSRLRFRCRSRSLRWLLVCAALLGWRKDIVRHAPQLASFYSAIGLPVNLRGLAFTDLKIGNEIHDGVPVLVVEGMIVSTVSMPVDVPRLRFALRNATGAEVYSWTAQPSQPVLEAVRKPAVPQPARLAARGRPRHAGAVLHPPRRGRRRCAEAAVARILIAEDEEPVRALVARALAEEGHAGGGDRRRRRGARHAAERGRRLRPAAGRHQDAGDGWHRAGARGRARLSRRCRSC